MIITNQVPVNSSTLHHYPDGTHTHTHTNPGSVPQVDLYSLGVVVFEMWHPFATAMERAVLLQQLRDHGSLPEEWEKDHAKVAKLIR